MEAKRTLRSNVLARRDAMPEATRARKSETVCARLEEELETALARRTRGCGDGGRSGFEDAGGRAGGEVADRGEAAGEFGRESGPRAPTVAVFAPMRSEVDVMPFVESAYRRGWDVCFPCMVREAEDAPSSMRFFRVPREQLEAARTGFLDAPMRCVACAALEGAGYAPVIASELDAVVVPLVAFDERGGRLGYGGGNYDRLLPRLREDAVVVGVAFEEQRVDAVPVETHDRPLPCIVSA